MDNTQTVFSKYLIVITAKRLNQSVSNSNLAKNQKAALLMKIAAYSSLRAPNSP